MIIGAGLIGLKCAEGILERVGSVTVVDMADRILPSILDAEGARIMQDFLEKKGVRFVLSDSVARFSGGRAVLKSGKELAFDTLVICVGVRPNTALAEEAGCRMNRGIVTDSACQTSVPGIYAAGDCATSFDCTTGTERVLALLPNAYMQGYAAGVNMAGGNKQYENAMPMNAIGFSACMCSVRAVTKGTHILYRGKRVTRNSLREMAVCVALFSSVILSVPVFIRR